MRKCISMLVSLAIGISAFAPLSALAAEAEPVQISTPEELQAAVTNGGTYKVADGVETFDCSELQLQIRGNVSTHLDLDLNGAEVIVDNDLIRMVLQSFARPGIYQGILDGDDFSEMFHIPMFSISADPSLRS